LSEIREFTVSPSEAGVRLDVFLARHMPGWTRSQLQQQIRCGLVTVGSRTVYKAGEALEAGVRIGIRAARHELQAVAEDLPLEVIYEDADLVVVNKPAGMATHPGAGVKSGTLVNALLHHVGTLSRSGGELRPGIVHRLDRMTSGLVVVAKNDQAHTNLTEQFKAHQVLKTYLALAHGKVREDAGTIRKPVGRDPWHRVRMRAGGLRARPAQTTYRVIRRFSAFTLLEVVPRTGRTHQIRVHLASLGHPVVGDTLYGAPSRITVGGREQKTLERNFLHAARLEFRHPRSGAPLSFQAPLPADLEEFLGRLA
jgi:23S rRNA pseudouridine1911/1915/1917 synthase